MQNRTSLEGSPEEDGDGESDYEPRTEEDSIVANSPDIISEIASEVAEVEGRRCQLDNCVFQGGLNYRIFKGFFFRILNFPPKTICPKQEKKIFEGCTL